MNHLRTFKTEHQLRDDADLEIARVAINALYNCHKAVSDAIEAEKLNKKKDVFLNLAYGNIIARIFEQADGMLASLATRCAPSAEALARVVIESSVNLMYISQNGLESPLIGYFDRWLSEHKQKLSQWRDIDKDEEASDFSLPMIDARIAWLESLQKWFDTVVSEHSLQRVPFKDSWPRSLFKRFQGVGKEGSYLTSYHRLSTSSHLGPEDTLSWLVGCAQQDHDLLERLGEEAVSYSIMMSRVALVYYIDGLAAFCRAKFYAVPLALLEQHKRELMTAIFEISADAGCPE